MTPVVFCFFMGGVVVPLFAILGDPLEGWALAMTPGYSTKCPAASRSGCAETSAVL